MTRQQPDRTDRLASRAPMSAVHEAGKPAPWTWALSPQQARRLRAADAPRWLAVEQGRVWLTRSRQDGQPSEDIWLCPGERQLLPAGTEWVAEGWPQAQVCLLEAPPQ